MSDLLSGLGVGLVLAIVLWVVQDFFWRRPKRKPKPHNDCATIQHPCPICQTSIPLTVHRIPVVIVRVDRTDLALHLMTHEEKR